MINANETPWGEELKLMSQTRGVLLSALNGQVGDSCTLELFSYKGVVLGTLHSEGRNLSGNKVLFPQSVVVSVNEQGIITVLFTDTGKLYSLLAETSYMKSSWGVQTLPLIETEHFSVEMRGRATFVWFKDAFERVFRTTQLKALSVMGGTLKVVTKETTMVFDL